MLVVASRAIRVRRLLLLLLLLLLPPLHGVADEISGSRAMAGPIWLDPI